MPILLKPLDSSGEFTSCASVLFVACHVCPRMCLAVEKKEPYFSISHLFKKRDYFSEFIAAGREVLEREKIHTACFKTPLFSAMMCLWPENLRMQLMLQASRFDAVAVIGCQSAVHTVTAAMSQSETKIVPIMEEQGVANFKTKIRFPFTMELSE
jgi:hypothetical protein